MKPITNILLKSLILSAFLLTQSPFLNAGDKKSSGANITMGDSQSMDGSSDWRVYQRLAKYVIGVSLFLSLIIVIYHVANNTPKAKTAIVSWITAVIIYCIAINIFGR